MRLGSLVALGLVVTVAGSHADCGDGPDDAAAFAGARAAIAVGCDCAGASSRAAYLECVRTLTGPGEGLALSPACRRAVRACAARSTCGRPGAVTCCRTRRGRTRCAVKRSVAGCTPRANETACAGLFASCCDACVASGCAARTTTSVTTTTAPNGTGTTTSSTTTTTIPFVACVGGGTYPTCGGTCASGLKCVASFEIGPGTASCVCIPAGAVACSAPGGFPACAACVPGTPSAARSSRSTRRATSYGCARA